MIRSIYQHTSKLCLLCLLLLIVILGTGCGATKHIPEGQYLLRSNSLKLKSDQSFTRRGELSQQLNSLIIQKPNTYVLGFPYKLWLYNGRYKKYSKDTSAVNFQLKTKTVERPVIYDSSLKRRSILNLKSYLFNQGYFYSDVRDTTLFKGKKAYVTYKVNTGMKYLLGKSALTVDDSLVYKIVMDDIADTKLKEGKPFSMTMAEEERSRIANLLRNNGYYKITQDNVSFVIDTVNKAFLRDVENPFENAINFLALQKNNVNPTLDIRIIIAKGDEENAFRRYKIGKVQIFPDYVDRSDIRDTTMVQKIIDNVTFRYHNHYIRESVLLSHNFLRVGEYYSQDNYDRTITKLNELGIFQYVRTFIAEDTTLPYDSSLRCVIILSPAKRYDYTTNFEVSNGSTYDLGNDASITFRNRNWLGGANQLALSLSAGVEMAYDNASNERSIFNRFYLLSKNAGINGTITFPKFISPIKFGFLRRFNQPRTIVGLGYNLLDRLDYFTLNNVVANYTYNWTQNETNTWDLTPTFVNILRLPSISDSFQRRLDSNEFLANSYRENFIEGENISFTFSDANGPNARRGYSYMKISLEEAGGLFSAARGIVKDLGFDYSQYVKIDLDARHYFRRPNATFATRFFAGVGLPYDRSQTLPYVKQYFVGGAYSIRGWRVRQLGPGSYYDTTASQRSNFIDRIGDVKLEANAEYRFNMIQLFSGAIHLNGALFADAGNIWLSNASPDYPGGEFSFDKLGQDIAISTGAGLRVDIGGLFILRFDGAFPIKKPYVKRNSGWVLDGIHFDNSSWRNDNLILNIAIGYPF